MKKNRNYLWIFSVLILSCKDDGFRNAGNQIQQKMVQLATGEKSIFESSHFAAAVAFGKAEEAPLHFFRLYHHNLLVQTSGEGNGDTLQPDFKKLLSEMKEGEERIFRLPFSYFDDTFLSAYANTDIAAPNEEMQISIHILKTFDPGEFASHLMSMAQHNEISETEAIEWLLMNDTSRDYERHDQIFIQRIQMGDSFKIHTGDTLHLTYTTSFMDGRLIDRPTQLEYIPGPSGQLVHGLVLALKNSHCGDSLRAYIPSSLTFGEAGSLTGVIPPKTPLIFSVRIDCPQ